MQIYVRIKENKKYNEEKNYKVERLYSDAIVTSMHEKTSEIQIIVIARDVHKGKSMIEHRELQICGKFKIDTQGYDSNDIKKKLERVDVSPFGTEGIFIDVELPERDDEKK